MATEIAMLTQPCTYSRSLSSLVKFDHSNAFFDVRSIRFCIFSVALRSETGLNIFCATNKPHSSSKATT